MITNYNDPRVTLKQVYKGVVAGSAALLGACVIGPHYKVRTYQDFGEKLKIPDEYSVDKQSYSFKPLQGQTAVIKDTVKVFVSEPVIQKLAEVKGSVKGHVLTVDLDAENLEKLLSVVSGDKIYGSDATSYGTVMSVKRKDAKLEFTLDKKYDAEDATPITFSVRSSVAAGYIDTVEFIKEDSVVNLANPIIDGSSDIQGKVTINGKKLVTGKLYGEYSTYNDQYTKRYGYCAGQDAVQDMLGKVCPENPLAITVAAACANADDNFVYFIAVDQQKIDEGKITELQAYMKAADIVANVQGCYGIVPCTNKAHILQGLLGSAKELSSEEVPNFKYIYGSAEFDRDVQDKTGNDINTDQMVDDVITNKAFEDKRGVLVIADHARYKGQLVPNYVVAGAIAGLRSAKEAQAPLSNVSINGITTDDDSGFTYSDSKKLGANGFWRVGMSNYGTCITRRQLTSAATGDVNYDEQSIVCVVDSICLTLKNVGRSYVGNSNISPALLDILSIDLTIALNKFTRQTDPYIGPMLLSANIVQLAQDPADKSRIYASIEGEPPKPFNEFAITFYMN